MKIAIFFLLLGFSFSFNYDANEALKFDNQNCETYDEDIEMSNGSGANYVTQCLIAGGFEISNCLTDENGNISNTENLSACLTQKGWKSSTSFPKQFKAGYPMILGSLSFIATEVKEEYIKYSSNSFISLCNESLGGVVGRPIYFYL